MCAQTLFSHIYYTRSPIGQNKLAKIAFHVASFLVKPNPQEFTGHSFRTTSATVLVDEGSSIINLKRHGGWKSDSIAETYIRDSKKTKLDTASLLGFSKATTSDQNEKNSTFIFNNSVFNNCSFQPFQ